MKISVIIPVYNTVESLKGCIESVQHQTYRELEIILVNDGSTDGSGELCEEYAAQDERIKVFHQPNGGVSSARNSGLHASTGDFIGFVDSDDLIDSHMYEILMRNAITYQAQISCCPISRIEENSRIGAEEPRTGEKMLKTFEKEECLQAFLERKYLGFNIVNKIFRKEILKHEFRLDLRIAEDATFLFQAVLDSTKIVYTDATEYYYITRAGSATKSGFTDNMFGILSFTDFVFDTVERGYPQLTRKAYSFVYYKYLALINLVLFHDMEDKFIEEYTQIRLKLGQVIGIVRRNGDISLKNIYSYYMIKHFKRLYKVIIKAHFKGKSPL